MLEKLKNTVKKASSIMLEANEIRANSIKKSDRNFVTIYDKQVEDFIKNRLSTLYPEISFVGEEQDTNNIDPYTSKCFILDPIDGTANFRRTYKQSAISLAYVEYGIVKIGIVYQPYDDEMFYAEKGKGSYLNGERLQISETALKDSFVAFGTAPYYPELSQKTTKALPKIIADCEDIRRTGAAALDLSYIACGRHDMFFELSIFPWDYAASCVIIEEAGGVISDDKGNYPPLDKRSPIFAGNKSAYKDFFDRNYFIWETKNKHRIKF